MIAVQKMTMALIQIAIACGIFQCPVHPFHLTIRSGMMRPGQTMFDTILATSPIKRMSPRHSRRTCTSFLGISKLNTIICKNGMYVIQDYTSSDMFCIVPLSNRPRGLFERVSL